MSNRQMLGSIAAGVAAFFLLVAIGRISGWSEGVRLNVAGWTGLLVTLLPGLWHYWHAE